MITTQTSPAAEFPYSIYTKYQKAIIVSIVSFAALFSPFTINIYFPALLDIAAAMHTTISLLNLTITI